MLNPITQKVAKKLTIGQQEFESMVKSWGRQEMLKLLRAWGFTAHKIKTDEELAHALWLAKQRAEKA